MITKRIPRALPLLCAIGFVPLIPLMASAADQSQEYTEVRKIALKDARVQAAFQRANEKLDERILEIDPSLKPYVDRHNAQPVAKEPVKSKPAPVKHAAAPAVSASTTGGTHIVAKGDTLSSIAAHHNITVASLKSANNITDERKLRVGQKLVIPSSSKAPSKGGINRKEAPKKEQGFWEKLKSDF